MSERVDVVVVGLGPGGEEVAGSLAEAGLSVVAVEERLVGGECPYFACVPSKMMIRAANLLAEARRVDGMAGHAEVTPDWTPVAKRIRDEATDDWDDKVAVERLVGKGARFVRGSGALSGTGRVTVGDDTFEASLGVVLATGTSPAIPPIDGLAGTPYWTNRDVVRVEQLPGSLIVLGGGAVGVELAQVFARFGVRVALVEAADRLVPLEEPESSRLVQEALERDGVDVRLNAKVDRVAFSDGFTIHLHGGSSVAAERLLVATGRATNLGRLGLDTVGLDPSAKVIEVDDRMKAGDKLWAIGDLTGKGAFTHVSMYQAGIAVPAIQGQDGPRADYRALPRVTFTDPEVGSVGLTEAQAREQGLAVRTATAQIPSSARGWIHKAGNEGFIKLVVDADRDIVVGATSAGPTGGEVLSGLAVAVHGAVPVSSLRQMIFAYPTFHRAIGDALTALLSDRH
jgi:pyruvate/2-oxoglutarate dehydrogenase complex dihydrolipoamide dehydrogenase (E3) component